MTRTYSDVVAKLVEQAGLPQGYDENVAAQIRKAIKRDTGKKVTPTLTWPGTPMNFTLIFVPTLHAMVETGEVEIIEQPRVTDPTRTAKYVRFVNPTTNR